MSESIPLARGGKLHYRSEVEDRELTYHFVLEESDSELQFQAHQRAGTGDWSVQGPMQQYAAQIIPALSTFDSVVRKSQPMPVRFYEAEVKKRRRRDAVFGVILIALLLTYLLY